jgi:hypothetical protein
MNAQRTIFACLVILLLVLNGGCKKPPVAAINKALNSTNVVFQPTPSREDIFTLSPHQIVIIKKVIERLNDRAQVKIEKEDTNLITPTGAFILGDVYFLWFGAYLYIYDSKAGRNYIVEDDILGEMDSAFKKAEGSTIPLNEPTQEQWHEILSVLEKAK